MLILKRLRRDSDILKEFGGNERAFFLFAAIVYEVNMWNKINPSSPKQYQAIIGKDTFPTWTVSQYRCAKRYLGKTGYVKFRGTNNGTIATLTKKCDEYFEI